MERLESGFQEECGGKKWGGRRDEGKTGRYEERKVRKNSCEEAPTQVRIFLEPARAFGTLDLFEISAYDTWGTKVVVER